MLKYKCIGNLTCGEDRFSLGNLYTEEEISNVEDFLKEAHFVGVEVAEEETQEEAKSNADLTVTKLKEALTALNVEIPTGAKKVDLVKLLDEAQANA